LRRWRKQPAAGTDEDPAWQKAELDGKEKNPVELPEQGIAELHDNPAPVELAAPVELPAENNSPVERRSGEGIPRRSFEDRSATP